MGALAVTSAIGPWVGEVAATFPWGPWRGLDRVAPGAQAAVLVGAVADAEADAAAQVVARRHGGAMVGVTTLEPKPMETELLGVRTAALSTCLTDVARPDRRVLVESLLEDALSAAADGGVDLLVHRIDSEDVDALAAAQALGFRVCEATASWLVDADAPETRLPLPEGTVLTTYEGPEVPGALRPVEVAALSARTAAWDQNHFRADPRLDDAAVDRFYGAWIGNIASGAFSDFVAVLRRGDDILGIQSERTDRTLLAHTGLDVRVAEWLVVLAPGEGAGAVLMHAAGSHRRAEGRHHWWETQLRNLATIRSFEATGRARPVRSAYTLHAWPRG